MVNRTHQVWTTNNHDSQENISSRVPTANGNDKFSVNGQFLIPVQSKFRRKYYHKFVFIILLTIILILSITIICLAIKAKYYSKNNNVCETKECLRTASNLLQSMDLTIDPCEDFYSFTCGNWPDEHPRPDTVTSYDWFSEKQTKIIRQIRSYLQLNESNTDPKTINKARIMYKACVNTDKINKIGIEPLFHYLNEYKLPIIPSLLNRTLIFNNNNNENTLSHEFDWIETIVKIKKSLEMDLLIGFDIFPDPKNRSNNLIGVGTPETGSALPFNNQDNRKHMKKAKKQFILELFENEKGEENEDEHYSKKALNAYLEYIRKVVSIVITTADPDIVLDDIMENITNAAVEVVHVTKYIYKLTEDAENSTKSNQNLMEDLKYLTIDELQNATDEAIYPKNLLIWDKYFKLMMSNLIKNQNSNNDINWKTEKILTSKEDLKYLQDIIQFISNTSSLNLEFYLWWNVIEELVIHTTTNLRQLHNDYTKIIIKTEGTTTRSLYCTNCINSLIGMAVSYAIIDKNFLNITKPKVELMLVNIRLAFDNLVKNVEWMDNKTKLQTIMKSKSMKSYIGFPEWIMNKTKLDEYYNDINVNYNTHLNNMIELIKWKMNKKLLTLKLPNQFEWATSPSNVNAFHTFQSNTITIPIAILQFPFYNLGLEALNYGAIGTILGHELTHGFDDSGRMFDKCGNMRQWWTNSTITEYINRTSCFIKQYGNYYVPDVNDYINGELTLGENIADNGGLREAYYAYKLLVDEIGEEKLLPGFENYSHEQLLFISFGNLWCETYTQTAAKYVLEDTHCPGQIRLKGVLSNSPEFSNAFKCKKGSGMYPSDDRCKIW